MRTCQERKSRDSLPVGRLWAKNDVRAWNFFLKAPRAGCTFPRIFLAAGRWSNRKWDFWVKNRARLVEDKNCYPFPRDNCMWRCFPGRGRQIAKWQVISGCLQILQAESKGSGWIRRHGVGLQYILFLIRVRGLHIQNREKWDFGPGMVSFAREGFQSDLNEVTLQ